MIEPRYVVHIFIHVLTKINLNHYGSFRPRSKITRNIPVTLSEGLNRIEVMNLSSKIDSDAVTVEGIGNAVVLDVIYSESQV